MTGRLAGKRALLTAAGQGIGRATALAFAAEGAEVWATDLDPAKLSDLAAEASGLHTRVLDVLAEEEIAGLAAELGALDVLFNCAGHVHHGTVLETSDRDWDFAFRLNVRSMFWTIRAFLPAMIAAGGGSIVNVASVVGSVKGVPNRFAYGATKGAVVGLTKSVAADFIGKGIRCNAICPATIHTPSWEGRVAAAADPAQAERDFLARQPLGRIGTPKEVAALAVYLAADESAYTTGAVHLIDGGMAM